MSRPGPIDRVRQTRRLLRAEGYTGVAARLANRVSRRISPPGSGKLRIEVEDLERAAEIAASGWILPSPIQARPGEPLTIAWVTTTPGPGSGGHTTMFRLVSALERAGHRCVIYLMDEDGWALERHEQNIRSWWPWVNAEVRDLADGIEDAHATLGPLLGSLAPAAFGIALLASGLSSSTVGTMAGQMIVDGFMNWQVSVFIRRLITMIPALIVIAAGADTLRTLVASQVVLSLVLPFAVVPLVWLTSRRDVMGELVNGPVIRALAIGVAGMVIAMNVVLLVVTVAG